MAAAASCFQNFVTETGAGALCVGRRTLHIVRRFGRIGGSLFWRGRLERNQLDVEHEHPGRAAFLPFVSKILWNPETPFLFCNHQLDALRPASNDLIERE